MRLHIRPRPDGVPRDLASPLLPGSKSHTQRAMLIAGFGAGRWQLEGALVAEDTEFLALALQALGARCSWPTTPGGALEITGRGPRLLDGDVFVGENGTAARALSVLAPMLGGRLRIDGREGLQARPMDAAIDFLRAYGAVVRGKAVPLVVDGRQVRWPHDVVVNGRHTTQVATGALLGQALRPRGLLSGRGWRSVRVEGVRAAAYLDVSARMLENAGCRVGVAAESGNGVEARVYRVRGAVANGGTLPIAVDPSTRAFPAALAAMHGIDGLSLLPTSQGDPHPDWQVDRDIEALVAAGPGSSSGTGTGLSSGTASGSGSASGSASVAVPDVLLDRLSDRPDCVPVLAALAATRSTTTRITDVPNLRLKESDRLAAMARGLAAAGARVDEQPDGLTITGPLAAAEPTDDPRVLPTTPDHRIVMSLALLGTVLPCGVVVDNTEAVRKSWPGFFDWLEQIAVVALA